jgi:hypothetical protein
VAHVHAIKSADGDHSIAEAGQSFNISMDFHNAVQI